MIQKGKKSKTQYKTLYKIIALGIVSSIQVGLLILLVHIYNGLFPIAEPNWALEVVISLYLSFFIPIGLAVGNSITMFLSKSIFHLAFFIVALIFLFSFWGEAIFSYPFRVGYIIVCSIAIYLLGMFIISRIRDWISE